MEATSATRRRSRRRRRRWILGSLGLVVVAAVAALWVLRPPAPPQRVFLEHVRRASFQREVSGTGTVVPARSRRLTFPSAGTVGEVLVDEGARVEAGAALARLDTRALERELASNRAALASARADANRVGAQQRVDRLDAAAAVSTAEDRLASARQARADAASKLDALERLYQAGGVSLDERDGARTALDEAERQQRQAALALTTARGRLQGFDALAQAQIASAEASVQRLGTAVANLEQQRRDATLTAPFAGVVASLPFKVGDSVGPAAAQALELVDDSSVSVTAEFDENRSVDLADGQAATVSPDAAPDLELPARVTRVGAVAVRGAGTAALEAELAFAPADGAPLRRTAVLPGYTVSVKVVVHRLPDALVLPLEAVQRGEGASFVYRVRRGEPGRGVAERVPVTVLDRNATLAAVADGALQPGDAIAVTNVDRLADGDAVSFEAAAGGG